MTKSDINVMPRRRYVLLGLFSGSKSKKCHLTYTTGNETFESAFPELLTFRTVKIKPLYIQKSRPERDPKSTFLCDTRRTGSGW